MPYIKISDPLVIDISAWHQVVNVVNQHSDTLNVLTNSTGVVSGTTNFNAEELTHQFDMASQKIMYGRAKITSDQAGNNGTLWYGEVTFTFRTTPIVTATAFSGNTSGAVSASNDDVIVSVYNVSASGFKYRVYRAGSTKAPTGTVYINWIAIGQQ